MSWMSLRNDWLEFKTLTNLPTILETYGLYPKLIENHQKTTTCNWLDLETLGFRLVMPKFLYGH